MLESCSLKCHRGEILPFSIGGGAKEKMEVLKWRAELCRGAKVLI